MNLPMVFITYLCIINLIGFILMGIDKKRAIRHAYRIPEATLFCIAVFGGSLGSILGMYFFRHKTKHRNFVIGMPAIFVVETLIILYTIIKLIYN